MFFKNKRIDNIIFMLQKLNKFLKVINKIVNRKNNIISFIY